MDWIRDPQKLIPDPNPGVKKNTGSRTGSATLVMQVKKL
jgi:hypothetical protein